MKDTSKSEPTVDQLEDELKRLGIEANDDQPALLAVEIRNGIARLWDDGDDVYGAAAIVLDALKSLDATVFEDVWESFWHLDCWEDENGPLRDKFEDMIEESA